MGVVFFDFPESGFTKTGTPKHECECPAPGIGIETTARTRPFAVLTVERLRRSLQ